MCQASIYTSLEYLHTTSVWTLEPMTKHEKYLKIENWSGAWAVKSKETYSTCKQG